MFKKYWLRLLSVMSVREIELGRVFKGYCTCLPSMCLVREGVRSRNGAMSCFQNIVAPPYVYEVRSRNGGRSCF